MRFLVNFQSNWSRDGLCTACTICKFLERPAYEECLGQGNFKNVSKAGNPPMKQSKKSVLLHEIMYAMFWQVMTMLMGIVGQAVLGLCERARPTDSA
jgi:hypothetical protein